MDEDLLFSCPCCRADLEIDETGDLVLVELPELNANESRGLGNLTVSHQNHDPRSRYHETEPRGLNTSSNTLSPLPKLNSPQNHVAPVRSIEDIDIETDATSVSSSDDASQKLLEANRKDLKAKNIRTKSKWWLTQL